LATEKLKELKTVATLTPAQYYQWALSIEKMKHAKTRAALTSKTQTNMELSIELSKLKSEMHKRILQTSQEEIKLMEAEYNSVRDEIYKSVGLELGCAIVIDEVTFEVKKEVEIENS
jgi:hypothetical protein